MRTFRSDLPQVRMKPDVPDWDALITDYDLWHHALNYWYVARDEVVEDSWLRMVGVRRQDPEWHYANWTDYSYQATFWELRPKHVVSVGLFDA